MRDEYKVPWLEMAWYCLCAAFLIGILSVIVTGVGLGILLLVQFGLCEFTTYCP